MYFVLGLLLCKDGFMEIIYVIIYVDKRRRDWEKISFKYYVNKVIDKNKMVFSMSIFLRLK